MSAGFRAVQWNRAKLVYDAILLVGVILYIGAFLAISRWITPPTDPSEAIDLRIRAFGSCAFIMLTIILAIGPLARLNPRLLPLLYNRRHFGVLTFIVAALHFFFLLQWYAAQGGVMDLASELTSWADYAKFIGFPFKTLGLLALIVMFLMAATSHDFWLVFLTPPVWKGLHMGVYVAYGLVVMHVALGVLQDEPVPLIPALLIVGAGGVIALHLVAGWRERAGDKGVSPRGGWIAVGAPHTIPDKAARIVAASGGERIAVFRDGAQIAALTNLCAHQHGPLGEGRIVEGCVTCPWHGYQYRLADGCAPPPFKERLATYPVRLRDGVVEVYSAPLPPGTPAAIIIAPGA